MPDQSRPRWKYSTAIIAVFWTYLLVDAYLQGLEIPALIENLPLPAIPTAVSATILTLTFSACFLVTFWQRRHLMEDLPFITAAVDRRYGTGTYASFSWRLRPVAISMLSSLVLASTILHTTFTTTGSITGYLLGLVFLAIAAGLLTAYLLSRRYPPMLR